MKWHLYPCSMKKTVRYLDSPVLGCGRGLGCGYCVLLVSIAVCHVQWSWVCKHYQHDNKTKVVLCIQWISINHCVAHRLYCDLCGHHWYLFHDTRLNHLPLPHPLVLHSPAPDLTPWTQTILPGKAHNYSTLWYTTKTCLQKKIKALWDVTHCHWVTGSWCSEGVYCLHQGWAVQIILPGLLDLQAKDTIIL